MRAKRQVFNEFVFKIVLFSQKLETNKSTL